MVQSLFQYHDYREFFRDHYEEQKALHEYYSFRFLGLKLELDPGTLQRITQGKAHLSGSSIKRVVEFLKLSPQETEYFETLILYNKAKSERESKKFFDELQRIKDLQISALSELQYQYFSEWFHVPLRGLIGLGGFKDNYAQLAASLSPAITETQARNSVNILRRLNLIRLRHDGEWELQDAALTTGKKWSSVAINNFQHSMIEMAKESLERHPKEIRDISTVTLAIQKKDLAIYRLRCEEFRKSVMKLAVDTETPDSVFQINIQLFPMGFKNGKR